MLSRTARLSENATDCSYKLYDFSSQKIADSAWEFQPNFNIDVHTDAMTVQETLLASRSPDIKRPRKPSKTTMTDQTWELVCAKKQWRNALHDQSRQRSQTLQAMFFAAWRLSKWNSLAITHLVGFDELLCQLDQAIASALYHFSKLGKEVTRALRADDRAFFDHLAAEAAEFLAPNQIKDFWRTIRRHLPKFRNRQMGQDPNRLVGGSARLMGSIFPAFGGWKHQNRTRVGPNLP